MAKDNDMQDVEHYSPEKLLEVFSKSRIVMWISIAVVIHVVVIGVTSLGYIRDRWIDPEGAAKRKAAAEQLQKDLEKQKNPAPAVKSSATNAVPAGAAGSTNATAKSVAKPASTNSVDAKLQDKKDTPTGKRITEVAKTNEIPKIEGDIGISMDDTNAK